MMRAMAKARDRISSVRIRGFRSLLDVTLKLDGLSVLIGANGSGKSAVIEALETLRYSVGAGATVPEYFREHTRPIRSGQTSCSLAVEIVGEGDDPPLRYELALYHMGDGSIGVESERLDVGPIGAATEPLHALRRSRGRAEIFDSGRRQLVEVGPDPAMFLLGSLGSAPTLAGQQPLQQIAIRRTVTALRGIEVHVPFEVMPAWAARRTGRRSASRDPVLLQAAPRLELLAANLGNVYHSLKNEHGSAHWTETLDLVRQGLGEDVDDVSASADASGGQHAITVRFRSSGAIPAAALSDGTLAYLAFVALLRLPSERSVLAFDEPELHLHPALLIRVLAMFESVAHQCPVILATHSDRLLDALQDPAGAAILCELDEQRATRLHRPDRVLLEKWLKDFRGLGDLRSAGLQATVMGPSESLG